MKGKYKVIVQNNRLHYELEIRRNITIIQGNSATGKTTLVNMLRQQKIWGIPVESMFSAMCHAEFWREHPGN